MKDIDFLPESYKSGMKWRISLRNQCIIAVILLFGLSGWDMANVYELKGAMRLQQQRKGQVEQALAISKELSKVQGRLQETRSQFSVLRSLDSKVKIPNVLGELSYVMGSGIVLEKLNIKEEKLKSGGGSGSKKTRFTVRAADGPAVEKNELQVPVRHNVQIVGMAADSSDVARLIQRMEDSAYFHQVYPSYSRNKQLKMDRPGEKEALTVSEFALDCYIANYTRKQTRLASTAK